MRIASRGIMARLKASSHRINKIAGEMEGESETRKKGKK